MRSQRPSFLVTSVILLDTREHLSADAVSNPPGPRTTSSQPRGREPSGTAPEHSTHFPVTLGRPEIDALMCGSLTGRPGPDPTRPLPSSHFLFLLAKVKQRETATECFRERPRGPGGWRTVCAEYSRSQERSGPPGHHPSIHSLIHPSRSVIQSFTQFSFIACWPGARPRIKRTENSTMRFLPFGSFRSGGVSGGGKQGAP